MGNRETTKQDQVLLCQRELDERSVRQTTNVILVERDEKVISTVIPHSSPTADLEELSSVTQT